MTREEFYKLTDILNSEVLGNFMHGGEADELIAMFEEAVEHSNILEQEEPVINDLEEAARKIATRHSHITGDTYYTNDAWFFKKGAQLQKQQLLDKACEWIKQINNHHYIMRYSDSCEPSLNELTEWFRNYMKEE